MTGHQEAASGKKGEARVKKRKNTTKKSSLGAVVDRGTETVERLHRAIASWPLDALERVRRFEKPVGRMRKLQERAITARYAFLRGVNREVTQLVRSTSRKKHTQEQRGDPRGIERPRPKKVSQSEVVARAS